VSLIADALKRAQRGVSGRAQPPGTRRSPRSSPGGAPGGRRLVFLVALIVGGAALAAGTLWLRTPARKSTATWVKAPPPILEEKEPSTAAGRRAAPKPQPKDETTISDVLAALQLKPEDEPRATPPGGARAPRQEPARTTDARREQALERARKALEGEAPPAPAPPAPAVPPKAEAPKAAPSPPPTFEVHAAGKEAIRFFTDGVRHQRAGRYAQAIEEYERAIGADSGNLEALNNLGVLLKETGRLDQAVDAFQRALALDPKYEKALNNLGVVRYLKGQYEEAIGLFRRAIVINPENVESYTNLGIIYLLAERLDEARAAFERALQLDPKHTETHYNLALLYERRGIWTKALGHYQRFLELAQPRHASLAAKVRDRLRTLAERR